MRRTVKSLVTFVAALLLLFTAGCLPAPAEITPAPTPVPEPTPTPIPPPTPEPTPIPTGEKVNFRFLISDEANDIKHFEHLYVTISSIGVQRGGESGKWYPLDPVLDPDGDGIDGIDLTMLQGDNATEIWSGYVDPGEYTKVFIYVDNVTGILAAPWDVETVDVKLPSEKLQISKPFTISSDSVVNFVYDITVVKAGKSGKYILQPQIAQSGPNQKFTSMTPPVTSEEEGEEIETGAPEALEITTTSLSDGQVGVAYTATLEATGGTENYTWSISDGELPDGLELVSDTSVISGNPTTAGDYEFTVQVEDSSDPVLSDTGELSVEIEIGP